MSDAYNPHEDELYVAIREPLLDAIQAVLQADVFAARKAHHVSPHLRLKDLNKIKNDDVADFSARRLANIARGLGIKLKSFELELPRS